MKQAALKRFVLSLAAGAFSLGLSLPVLATVAQSPLFVAKAASPMVMLAVSVDHQLFKKAYPDYSDLDGDGVLDTSYKDSFDYYGYFDSGKCYAYRYNSAYGYTGGRFEPVTTIPGGPNGHHCNGDVGVTLAETGATTDKRGEWSGNFLNWATMTRIDILRKALYGGKRSTGTTTGDPNRPHPDNSYPADTSAITVLEREYLPNDIHSFAKVFAPAGGASEMLKYTPFALPAVSFCNTTQKASYQGGPPSEPLSQDVNTYYSPPRMLVASGSYPRWASGERTQCQWQNNNGAEGNFSTTNPESPSTANNLFWASAGKGFNVRVRVCMVGREEANCKAYGSGVKKPVGLLQEYGEDGSIRFGLISGSYAKRDKGGVLRRNIGKLAGNTTAADNEINSTDGTFTGNSGIISSLNRVRINQWRYSGGMYNDCDTWGINIPTYLTSNATNRRCSNWGNPIGEIYGESLRYFTGATSATGAFSGGADPLGLTEKTWTDPMASTDWCAPQNVVLISSTDNSFDTDQISGLGLPDKTNAVGAAEGFSGQIFIGENSADTNGECTSKAFNNLSSLRGICPGAPSLQGGYQVAGLAHGALVTDLRPDRTNDSDGKGQNVDTFAVALSKELPELKFKAGSGTVKVVPTFMARYGDLTWNRGTLADVVVTETKQSGGSLTYARFLSVWEDSHWGGDHDNDGIAQIAVCVGAECANHDDDGNGVNDLSAPAGQIRVANRAVSESAGFWLKFGFSISGTTADGEYLNVQVTDGAFSSVLDGNNNPTAVRPASRTASDWSNPDVRTFTPGATSARLLPSPLSLAAKYGGFKDTNGNDLPDQTGEWDADGDGSPDNFFQADNPSQLGPRLSAFIANIAEQASFSAAVANSGSLDTGTRLYLARFDSASWTGQLLALPINTMTGAVADPTKAPNPADASAPLWDAGAEITTQNFNTGRKILTWNPSAGTTGQGIPFRWANLNPGQQSALNTHPTTRLADGRGSDRLDWLRGDASNEARKGGPFRDRGKKGKSGGFQASVLGDIVHGSPVLVSKPNFGYPDNLESARYSAFATAKAGRPAMLYFGANDGMLHGVEEATGKEKIAYVPNALFADASGAYPLSGLTSPNYSHRYSVDGPPTVVDAFFGGGWHTVLAGSLGAGGRAAFALDVTDPAAFSEGGATNLAMWEKTETDLPDLGYTFSQPAIFKAKGDGWVVAFGNGYESTSGKAVLYFIGMDGRLVKTLTLDAGPNNGLSSISPVDTNRDGEVDLIYAGDLKGNVWRLTATGGGFNSGNIRRLYTAKANGTTPQPITSRLEVGLHPLGSGYMVYFGTGKFYETSDNDPSTAAFPQTIYGIWDDGSNNPTVATVTNHGASGSLLKQTISEYGNLNGYQWRTLTNTNLDWNSHKGWFIDLPIQGESVAANPTLRGGRLIFVTWIPSSSLCSSGGDSWLMEVDSRDGSSVDRPVFDLNGDGTFSMDDMLDHDNNAATASVAPAGKKSRSGILQPPAILLDKSGKREFKYSSGSKGGVVEVTLENPGAGGRGRKSWIQLQ